MRNTTLKLIFFLICVALYFKSAAQEVDTTKAPAKRRFFFYPIDQSTQMERKQLNLAPNPAKDFVEIRMDNPSRLPFKLEMFDFNGSRVLLQEWKGEKIDLNPFASGLYILKLSGDRESFSGKLLIKK
jgi:hypothetical protein